MRWVTRAEARVDRIACPGFREISRDDFENMERQFPVYDTLYAYCRSGLKRGA
jgi:hypothetical protein